ncbi:uncharacterized protein LOC119555082 isoform X1 [Drosophila subpulchrella]|uniref:uncharacterized protein LOC119555082 isoform X1 n=2 Tax=Drosophila subpulchrella TaxID=1486046 RepID=UPI0018A1550E|nr:uncharacterized protein LOC119555082 isoform X1 [Drosophila subpulchrella]
MNSQRNKFKRGQNFSTEEEFLLITMAAEQRKIFENKKNDGVTWKEKELAWENLAVTYASKSGIQRSALSLRSKYESLKKKLAAGLPYGQPPKTPSVAEKLRQVLGDEDTGDENSDSDCIMNELQTDGSIGDIIEFNEENSSENVTSKPRTPIAFEANMVAPPTEKTQRKRDFNSQFQEEKFRLIRAQRRFYEQENVRAQEKHLEEMETLSAKRELLYLEIAEKKRKLKDSPSE